MSDIKASRTRNLRYKRPALASLGYDTLLRVKAIIVDIDLLD